MLVVSLSACAANDKSDQSMINTIGGVLGGFAGGALGSTIGKGMGRGLAMAAGVAIGAKLGHDFAKDLSKEDKLHLDRATDDALNMPASGQPVNWSNPNSGTYGAVTADQVTTTAQGENCRQFETTVNVKGETRAATGTACRTQNGAWEIIADPEATT